MRTQLTGRRWAATHAAGTYRRRLRAVATLMVALALSISACSSGSDRGTATTAASVAPTTATTSAAASTATSSVDPVDAAQARVDAAEAGVTAAQDGLAAAGKTFCGQAGGYLEALDRYGKLFSDDAATVGDVTTAGADLVAPRDSVSAAATGVSDANAALTKAQQELIDAQAALVVAKASASSSPIPSTTAVTATTAVLAPPASIERVEQAEDDLAKAGTGITESTPLTEATAEYNSAAFALQIAWLRLLSDAGCLTDEQQAKAVDQVTGYTKNLQSQLAQTGYYAGEIDGIYGPETVAAVKKLQADGKLPQTGFVDMATAQLLADKVAAVEGQAADVEMTQTAAVQTVLTLTGFWTGPVDGQWTDELTAALKAFQKELGVKQTGEVDTATLAAFEDALAKVSEAVTSATASPTAESSTAVTTSTVVTTSTAVITSTALTTSSAVVTVSSKPATSTSSPAAPTPTTTS